MRLFILGATGGVGSELVEQALARGNEVTALARSPGKIRAGRPALTVVSGDPLDSAQLKSALPGHDAVLSALGHRRGSPAALLASGARALVSAMRQTGRRRLLVVSVAMLFPESGLAGTILRNLIFRTAAADSREMERYLIENGDQNCIEWTIVRPPRLTKGPRTERYRVEDGHLPKGGASISRADVAHFMLNEAEHPAHIGEVLGVSL